MLTTRDAEPSQIFSEIPSRCNRRRSQSLRHRTTSLVALLRRKTATLCDAIRECVAASLRFARQAWSPSRARSESCFRRRSILCRSSKCLSKSTLRSCRQPQLSSRDLSFQNCYHRHEQSLCFFHLKSLSSLKLRQTLLLVETFFQLSH